MAARANRSPDSNPQHYTFFALYNLQTFKQHGNYQNAPRTQPGTNNDEFVVAILHFGKRRKASASYWIAGQRFSNGARRKVPATKLFVVPAKLNCKNDRMDFRVGCCLRKFGVLYSVKEFVRVFVFSIKVLIMFKYYDEIYLVNFFVKLLQFRDLNYYYIKIPKTKLGSNYRFTYYHNKEYQNKILEKTLLLH